MANLVSRFTTRLAYGARQLPRVAWYIGHGMVMRELSAAARRRAGATTAAAGAAPRRQTGAPGPDLGTSWLFYLRFAFDARYYPW